MPGRSTGAAGDYVDTQEAETLVQLLVRVGFDLRSKSSTLSSCELAVAVADAGVSENQCRAGRHHSHHPRRMFDSLGSVGIRLG